MEIVRTKGFDRDMKRLGATKDDLDALIKNILDDPEAGGEIKGLGGARKARFALRSRKIGKRGGGRPIYVLCGRKT